MKYCRDVIDKIKIKFNNTVQKSVISFDTECSTVFSENGRDWFGFDEKKPDGYHNNCEKQSFMYAFAFCIDGETFYGRTPEDLISCFYSISVASKKKNVVIYVHNLNYDFQVIRSFIQIDNVFARDRRTVLYAKSDKYNITFKCSYNLSGLKLSDIPAVYHTETQKLVGDLDYNAVRTYKTEMTEKELNYLENDVKIVYEYIEKKVREYGTIKKIPITKTGEVRYLFKQKLKKKYGKFYFLEWTDYINKIYDIDINVFLALNAASAGGYVHANKKHIAEIVEGHSYDKTSFYPSIMLTEKFPVSRFKNCDDDENDYDFDNNCYLFHLRLYDIKCKNEMTLLSLSQCEYVDGLTVKTDNGRVLSCDYVEVYMTDIDFSNFLRCYDISGYKIAEQWKAKKDYLPEILINFILDCYREKQEATKERDKYDKNSEKWKIWDTKRTLAKVRLNSIFGMTMTKNTRRVEDVWKDGGFIQRENDIQTFSEKLCEQSWTSLFPFSWGVWVMSYARRILFDAVVDNDKNVVYCDTDSIKSIGVLDLSKYDDEYDRKLNEMSKHFNVKIEDIIGIGHFVDETKNGMKFKTLGAKKYVCEIDKKVKCVASGINAESVEKEIGNDLNKFRNEMVFGYDAGCVCVYYNDSQNNIVVNNEKISQKFGVCIYPTKFKMKESIIMLEVM